MPTRCPWAEHSASEARYHDEEWGVPLADDRRLFELLVLEGAQAGLSWRTILEKREGYRAAFGGFDMAAMAHWGDADVKRLTANPAIVRNRAKIVSALNNARRALEAVEGFGSLAACLWRFVDGRPVQNAWAAREQVPAVTPMAEAMAKDLKKRGFTFLGPTTCYALMQSAGMVNDHLTSCFRYEAVAELGRSFQLR